MITPVDIKMGIDFFALSFLGGGLVGAIGLTLLFGILYRSVAVRLKKEHMSSMKALKKSTRIAVNNAIACSKYCYLAGQEDRIAMRFHHLQTATQHWMVHKRTLNAGSQETLTDYDTKMCKRIAYHLATSPATATFYMERLEELCLVLYIDEEVFRWHCRQTDILQSLHPSEKAEIARWIMDLDQESLRHTH